MPDPQFIALSKVTPRRRPPHWGPWCLNRTDPPSLWTEVGGYPYHIALDRCLTSSQVLDWIMQIAGKAWADDRCLAGLVRALDDVLNPQAFLCSSGRNLTITPSHMRQLVAEAAR